MNAWNGPRYYSRFDGGERTENTIEWFGESLFSALRGFVGFSKLFAPVIMGWWYTRGYLSTPATLIGLFRIVALATSSAYITRFVGRLLDAEYREFMTIWQSAKDGDMNALATLKNYDYCLDGTAPDFVAKKTTNLWFLEEKSLGNKASKTLAYLAVHSFGIRMLYPGATGLLNLLLGGSLKQARKLAITKGMSNTDWVNVEGFRRSVIQTTEGDLIDSVYKRGSGGNASTLVICFEGNAGYYEIGLVNTPEPLGYSVLGWNMPGFGESTGIPYPEKVLAAADAVWQYATEVLNYSEENIVLFGWSIGGFPSSWLAANHPNIKALVLDATFDDLLPLAQTRMPQMVSSVVGVAVRDYLNLNIEKLLSQYSGPIRLIRRLQEEILITDEGGSEEEKRASNRANALLKGILIQRHPLIVEGLLPQIRAAHLFAACEAYLVDFDANHVTPLSPAFFNLPSPLPSYLT